MTRLDIPSENQTLPARPVRKSWQGQRSLLVFLLSGQQYGIPLQDLREIVAIPQLSRYPGLPDILAGFLNLGGIAIPVLRLDRLFGVPDQVPGIYTPLIVLRHPDSHLALMVEKVSHIVSVSEDVIVPVPDHHSFNDCVVGVATLTDRIVLILSTERLLLEKEQQCLAEFQDREQMRLRTLEGQ